MNQKANAYSVIYEKSGVVCYENVYAFSFSEARKRLSRDHPDSFIHSVSMIDEERNMPSYNKFNFRG